MEFVELLNEAEVGNPIILDLEGRCVVLELAEPELFLRA